MATRWFKFYRGPVRYLGKNQVVPRFCNGQYQEGIVLLALGDRLDVYARRAKVGDSRYKLETYIFNRGDLENESNPIKSEKCLARLPAFFGNRKLVERKWKILFKKDKEKER